MREEGRQTLRQVNKIQLNSSFPGGTSQVVKNLTANAGDTRDAGSILGSGRCPVVVSGNALQFLAWRIPMDRGAWGHKEPDTAERPNSHTRGETVK